MHEVENIKDKVDAIYDRWDSFKSKTPDVIRNSSEIGNYQYPY